MSALQLDPGSLEAYEARFYGWLMLIRIVKISLRMLLCVYSAYMTNDTYVSNKIN